jgi:predicted aconitase with swiveling domain
LEGNALVTRIGFNTLASFYKSMLTNAKTAICSDHGNRELFGKNLTGRILCLPKAVGSTSAGAAWDTVAHMGLAPRALLFSQHIDSLSAAGIVLAEIWARKRICVVDQLGGEFLEYVEENDRISIREDGKITIWR